MARAAGFASDPLAQRARVARSADGMWRGLALMLAWGGCDRAPTCTGIDDPDGLWARAASVRVDVYGSGTVCQDNQVVAGEVPPQLTRTFDPRDLIELEVAP